MNTKDSVELEDSEAIAILASSHTGLFPGAHSNGKAQAAKKLETALLKALEKAGYEGVTGTQILIADPHNITIHVSSDANGVYFNTRRKGESFRESCGDKFLDYDPTLGAFVGKAKDTFLVQQPGEPHARRSAVAVASEVFIQTVDKARGRIGPL